MVVGVGFEAAGMPKQNHFPLPSPIHHRPWSKPQAPPNIRPHPSNQLDPDPATSPSNPGSATGRREPRSLNFEALPMIRGSRSVDHGPMCEDLGTRTMVQGSGKVAGKVLTVDL